MNSDLGELLREGIERTTTGERLRPGLAGRARQHHHKRALTLRAAALTGTAAVAAGAVLAATIGTGGSPQQTSGELPAQTTAYVLAHTGQALAAAGRGNLIQRVHVTPPRGDRGVGVFASLIGRRHLQRLTSQPIIGSISWTYRGRTRTQGFTSSGRLAADYGPSTATAASGALPAARIIVVDPIAGKWSRPQRLPRSAHYPLSCNQGIQWLGGGGDSSAQFSALVKKALSCHLFKAAGHQQVDGIDADRLVSTPRLTKQLRGNDLFARPGATLWVDPKTFLPVRLTLDPQDPTFDYGWLKPTSANLRLLQVRIPAGSHHVPIPTPNIVYWLGLSPLH
jgi:hypothetical protein